MGFLHRACWFVKYSVMIESNVTVAKFEVATPGPPPPGSLDICFCKDLLVDCNCARDWQFVELVGNCCLSF